MRDFMEPRETLLREFRSDAAGGLTEEQARENRLKYGENTLTRQKPESLWTRLREAASEPMILMLIGAGLIALGVNVFRGVTGGEADYLECAGIFLAISLSVVISVVMEGKSAKAFEALSAIGGNMKVKAVRGKQALLLSREEIVAGDILSVAAGDKVVADGRLLESSDLHADESALTGESVPAQKDAETEFTDAKTPLAERSNMLYSGTYITGGNGKMLVTSVGDQTEFGKIARELGGTSRSNTPLQEKLARLGKMITILGVTAASIVFTAQIISFAMHGGLVLEEVMEAFVTSIVLIVAAVPEGLPTIVAVSLSLNIIKLSKQNALVKKMIASETIGCINVICSDKTGTLTQNRMTVRSFYDNAMHEDAKELESEWLMHNICLNTTADLGENGAFIGNPSECAMLRFYEDSRGRAKTGKSYRREREEHETLHAFPFSSDLKHMTTISRVDGRVISYVKGSPECVLGMCRPEPAREGEIREAILGAERKAMRVIAFAHKELFEIEELMKDFEDQEKHREMESDMIFDGFIAISDPLRAEVYEAVRSCRDAGVALKILTGDNIVTATAIADELQLLGERTSAGEAERSVGEAKRSGESEKLTGEAKKPGESERIAVEAREIADLSDEELSERLASISVIARSTPSIKMRVVRLLKAQGNIVAVTGDGINDAPALKNADVGIAMGISGTEVSKEASDIVLLDDSFATIVKAVEWGRNIYENFKRFISFQLTVNMASVVVVLMSILLGLKAPFTALQLLWINIIMDGPPALTLGLEPNYADLMKRRPTSRSESIISKGMLARISVTAVYMSIVFLCQYVFNYLHAEEGQMTTVLFTMFVLFQLFNAFNCRELRGGSIFTHLLRNKLMLLVVGSTFLLQILIIQFAGAFFGTVPLGFSMWVRLFCIGASTVVLSEAVKFVWRAAGKK